MRPDPSVILRVIIGRHYTHNVQKAWKGLVTGQSVCVCVKCVCAVTGKNLLVFG